MTFMNIVKLNGEDTELYRRVAHLVMNREVLASNNNYPFKTSSAHIWFVACDDEGRTLGFIPVVLRTTKATINTSSAAEDDEEVLCLMLTQLIQEFKKDFAIISVTQNKHIQAFRRCGFSVMFEWEKYVKMIYNEDDQKKRL